APGPAAPAPVPVPVTTQHTRAVTQQQPREFAPAPPSRPDYALERRTQRRRTLGWIVAILVVALLLGYGGWWLGAGRLATVPTITGLDRAAAVTALEAAGVPNEIRGEYSDEAPVDAVLGTDPVAGERVGDGETVALLVSLGRPTVPKLPGGGDRATVEDELRRRTFEPVDGGTAFSNTVPEGGVAALDPGPGTELAVGSQVKVIVSKGSAPVEMPDVSGKKPDAARSQLEDAGLTVVDTREVFDPNVEAGRVSGTDPATGTEVGAGSSVTLLVSNAVKVPSLLGRSVTAARNELERLGFEVEVRQVADTDRSVVIGQSPGAGDRVEPGGTVTLTALP
ncbi:Stk1 family PASTA domain-containing Ser/Thr kinase, partial [Rhodococcus phenolicus]|uniref:Stk1 family PASTA domain-containing Ser/Thr kinase n=1 Tax=Rhodococcus phenolicus TaxID=263849 RepID=UPI000A80243F